jgi:Cu/Ag efflux protein CusF
MPPMTMTYRVQDAAALNRVAVGDKVHFTVQKADGGYIVTDLQKAN